VCVCVCVCVCVFVRKKAYAMMNTLVDEDCMQTVTLGPTSYNLGQKVDLLVFASKVIKTWEYSRMSTAYDAGEGRGTDSNAFKRDTFCGDGTVARTHSVGTHSGGRTRVDALGGTHSVLVFG